MFIDVFKLGAKMMSEVFRSVNRYSYILTSTIG